MRPAILIFAKAPRPGYVKTRLAATLGAERAAQAYERMVAHLIGRLQTADELDTELELHTDISTDAWLAFSVTRELQTEGDLGARMYHALSTRPGSMIVGGDVPTVPIAHLAALLASEADVSLGPCDDGGYYAIRARRTAPGMFLGVEWSSTNALEQTVAACRGAGLSVALGPSWFDVDTLEDLARTELFDAIGPFPSCADR